ncbi:hypothetical protein OUZ56_019967 [Daphnia magna]|uniref:Uncharacterized protein n=1 Tax=Daphnia magna TaxID=35525 RepID=A0ABQ9ZDV4_9CRUS|nr:hypothetical protein OUZ56_019967 [Daphnia magna]
MKRANQRAGIVPLGCTGDGLDPSRPSRGDQVAVLANPHPPSCLKVVLFQPGAYNPTKTKVMNHYSHADFHDCHPRQDHDCIDHLKQDHVVHLLKISVLFRFKVWKSKMSALTYSYMWIICFRDWAE